MTFELIGESSGLVFTTSTGRPISPRNMLRHFKLVIEKSGLPEIRFHDLRHAHATLLLAAGVHPKIVQERLGRSQISLANGEEQLNDAKLRLLKLVTI